MMTIHGERRSPIDSSQLPFSTNRAAGPNVLIPVAIFLTIMALASNAIGWTAIPTWEAFAPPVVLLWHVLSFLQIRNGVLHALQMNQHDLRLLAMVAEQHEQTKHGHLSQERLDAITASRS